MFEVDVKRVSYIVQLGPPLWAGVWMRWNQGHGSCMGLQVFRVSKPWGRRHHVVGAKCGAIGKGRAIDPLQVSKPPGFEHLEIKWTARWKPFLEVHQAQGAQSPMERQSLQSTIPWGFRYCEWHVTPSSPPCDWPVSRGGFRYPDDLQVEAVTTTWSIDQKAQRLVIIRAPVPQKHLLQLKSNFWNNFIKTALNKLKI